MTGVTTLLGSKWGGGYGVGQCRDLVENRAQPWSRVWPSDAPAAKCRPKRFQDLSFVPRLRTYCSPR